MPAIALTVLLGALMSQAPASEDWLQFRGSDQRGIGPGDAKLPLEWDDGKNVAWKADLPGRGVSSPILVGKRVVLTANSGFRRDRLHVVCLEAASGKEIWQRQFWATGQTQCHPKTCMAAPTPASDGERIFAFFSSNDLFCLDLEGNLLWLRGLTRDYPDASNSVGMSSSPLVIGDTVIVQVENDSDSFAAGLDVATGTNRWKIHRPTRVNWTSPVSISDPGGRSIAVLQSLKGLSGIDPRTGEEAWSYEASCDVIASSSVVGDTIYVPSEGLTAVRIASAPAAPEVLWKSRRLRPSTASPLVYRGQVYTVSGSILKCADAKSGDSRWQLRLEGPFSSSPVAAGGHLYLFNEAGLGQVVSAGAEGKLVGTGSLGETILATPAIAQGALYVRSDAHLWRIESRGE